MAGQGAGAVMCASALASSRAQEAGQNMCTRHKLLMECKGGGWEWGGAVHCPTAQPRRASQDLLEPIILLEQGEDALLLRGGRRCARCRG